MNSPELRLNTPIGTYAACAARGGNLVALNYLIAVTKRTRPGTLGGVFTRDVIDAAIVGGNPIVCELVWQHLSSRENLWYPSYRHAAQQSAFWFRRLTMNGYTLVGAPHMTGMDTEKRLKVKNLLLHEAMRCGNIGLLQLLDFTVVDLDRKRWGGLTLLASAASTGCVEVVNWLLSRGVEQMESAMIMAAARGYMSVVEALMNAGYDLSKPATCKEVHGVTLHSRKAEIQPFVAAAECGQFEVVKYFLQQGCIIGTNEIRRARNHLVVKERDPADRRKYIKIAKSWEPAMSKLLGQFLRSRQTRRAALAGGDGSAQPEVGGDIPAQQLNHSDYDSDESDDSRWDDSGEEEVGA
jgi:hypothetical protein